MPDPLVNVYSAEELREQLQDELARNPFLAAAPLEESNPDDPEAPRQ